MLSKVQTPWGGGNDSRKHIQTSRSAGCIYDPKKVLRPKEAQSKIFSCTPWQTYSKLFGMYDRQKFMVYNFIYPFLINIKIEIEKSKTTKVSNFTSSTVLLSYNKMLTSKSFMPKRPYINATKKSKPLFTQQHVISVQDIQFYYSTHSWLIHPKYTLIPKQKNRICRYQL